MVVLHDKIDNRSAFTATEAFPRLALRGHDKGRSLFAMKGTESLKVSTCFFECHPRANNVNDVCPRFDFVDITHPGSRTSGKTQVKEVFFQSALEKSPSLTSFKIVFSAFCILLIETCFIINKLPRNVCLGRSIQSNQVVEALLSLPGSEVSLPGHNGRSIPQ